MIHATVCINMNRSSIQIFMFCHQFVPEIAHQVKLAGVCLMVLLDIIHIILLRLHIRIITSRDDDFNHMFFLLGRGSNSLQYLLPLMFNCYLNRTKTYQKFPLQGHLVCPLLQQQLVLVPPFHCQVSNRTQREIPAPSHLGKILLTEITEIVGKENIHQKVKSQGNW